MTAKIILDVAVVERSGRWWIVRHVNATLSVRHSRLLIDTREVALVSLKRTGLMLPIKVFLEESEVLGVALESRICQITHERDKADQEVNGDVDHHADEERLAKAAFHLHTLLNDQQSQGDTDCVSCKRYEANDRFPAKSDAEDFEQTAVELVGSLSDGGEDHGIVFGDVSGNLLFDLLQFARFARVFDVGKEGVLCAAVSCHLPRYRSLYRDLEHSPARSRPSCSHTASCASSGTCSPHIFLQGQPLSRWVRVLATFVDVGEVCVF